MARCGKCSKDVGCGCNLVSGLCISCYAEGNPNDSIPEKRMRSTKRIKYNNKKGPNPPNTEFEQILQTQDLTKTEKLKRINEILEKAKQNAPL